MSDPDRELLTRMHVGRTFARCIKAIRTQFSGVQSYQKIHRLREEGEQADASERVKVEGDRAIVQSCYRAPTRAWLYPEPFPGRNCQAFFADSLQLSCSAGQSSRPNAFIVKNSSYFCDMMPITIGFHFV
jgi:hypothetical protein